MRVGIIFPFAGLGSVPSIVAAINALHTAGCQVDVFSSDKPDASDLDACSIHVRKKGLSAFMEDLIEKPAWARPIPYPLFELAAGPAVRTWRRRASLHSLVSRLHRESPFSWFIGVDPEGLVEAAAWSAALGVPYAHWSLEILVAGELTSPHLIRLKRREIRANRRAAFTVVQDPDRAKLLASENGIKAESMIMVPNAAAGPARRIKRYFAHRLFGIPEDSLVVLCAGTLADWCMTEEIVRATTAWPDGTVLIMHSRFDAEEDPYVKRIVEAADPDRVRFSRTPLGASDYRALIDSADVGLALYRPAHSERYLQANLLTIGLSSGKVSAYLQAGLPIVVNRLQGPAGLVDNYGCGRTVDTPDAIGPALESIATDCDEYSQGALQCFTEELQFERHFSAVFTRLSLDASKRSDSVAS